MTLWMGVESYDDGAKAWLKRSGHYLNSPPPGCIFCVVVRRGVLDLFGETIGEGERLGVCLVGRPITRWLPQDGSVGEVTRMVLADGLPHGTASAVLRFAGDAARRRGMVALISYHDRTRHTGCIYRKAGFRKDGKTAPPWGAGWGSRAGRGTEAQVAPKQRWRLLLRSKEAA
jgi:hypothetical protein